MNAREFLGATTRTANDADRDEDDELGLPKQRATPGKLTWTLDADAEQPAANDVVVARVDRRAEANAVDPEDGALASAFSLIRGALQGPSLPAELARRLAAELGVDVSRVRLHTDKAAAEAAVMLRARAFTIGDDIYFADGAYDPASEDGIQLIAHEVAHVAENQRGTAGAPQRVSRPDDQHEQRADEFARGFGRTRARIETNDPAEAVNFVRAHAQRVDLPHREEMEQHFGTSLGFVETYTGEAAQLACRLMAAGAFAVRNVVALADPSPQRDQLMHELTHVMQRGFTDAPEIFERGSLSIGVRGSAVEEEARLHPAQPTQRADANTIHRDDPPPAGGPDPAQAQARVLAYCGSVTLDGPDKDKVHWGVKNGAHCAVRYYTASATEFTGDTYAKAAKGDKADLEAAFTKGWAKDIGNGFRLHKTGALYVISKKDPSVAADDWQANVSRLTVQEKDTWKSDYLGGLKKIAGATGGKDIDFKWPTDSDALTRDDPPTSATELDEFRQAMRHAIAKEYASHDGKFGDFYSAVVQVKAFTNKITGTIFEEIVALSSDKGGVGAGSTSGAEIPVWDKNKYPEHQEVLDGFGKQRLDGDGTTSLSIEGENLVAINESKAYKDNGGPSAGDIKKMGQYYKLITDNIPGYVKRGDTVTQTKFNHAYYTIATPDPKIVNGKAEWDPPKVREQLQQWMDAIGTAFNSPAKPVGPADKGKKFSAKTWSLHPPPDGSFQFKVKFNPELAFDQPVSTTSINMDNPPVTVPGLKITHIQAALDGAKQVTSGSVTYGVDAADLKKAPESKPLTPVAGTTGGQVDNKVSGLTSKIKDYLPVDVDASIVDDGVQATIKLKQGQNIPSLAGFTLDAGTTEITATYKGGGTLSLDAEVGIKHSSKDIKGKISVTYDNGWGFNGKVTVGEGVIPGVSQFEAGVSKSPAGVWKIYADAFTVEKQFGQIKLTGTGTDLSYNVQTGMFSADLRLDADLGMFGKASGTAKIANNKLTKGSLSYDSPDFKYPAKSEAPALAGTVGGTINFNEGRFSGSIRGTANINIKGLQAVAGEKGLGLNVAASVTEDGNYEGSISTSTPLQFGKHIVIPAPLSIALHKDGSVTGAFSIKVVKLKWLDECSISCTADKDGIHVKQFHLEKSFGSEEKNKFWGKLTVDYTDDAGLKITGAVNYKIKEGMVASGTLTYNNADHTVSLHMEVSEITLLDSKIDRKTLFSASKKIPIINVYGIGAYIDIGFDLAFDMGFKLGIQPSVDFVDFSLETGQFKEIEAKLKLIGNIYAELIGTPKLGIGIFVLDPSILAGGGGLKMPITARGDINPTGTIDAKYQPDGGVSAGLAFDLSMTFGIHAALLPYAEFDVLSGMWNPKWEGTPITEFDILPKKELFKLHVDFGDDMTKKTDAPPTPGQNAAPEASGAANDSKFAQQDAAPADKGGGAAPAPVQGESSPSGGDDGPFSLSGLLDKLKGSVPGVATAERIFNIATKVWKVVKPIYEVIKPLFDLIGDRIEAFIDLFTTKLPGEGQSWLEWVWELAKKVLNLAFGGLIDLVRAIWSMLGKIGSLIKRMVTEGVANGSIGVKRSVYYIWRPWPWDDYNFMAAAQYKLNIGGVINDSGGPPSILLSPSGAIALGLYEVLQACDVPYTNTSNSDIGEPYNDMWNG